MVAKRYSVTSATLLSNSTSSTEARWYVRPSGAHRHTRRACTADQCSERPASCYHPLHVYSEQACEHAHAKLRGTVSEPRTPTVARCLGAQREPTLRAHCYVGERRADDSDVAGAAAAEIRKPAIFEGLHSTHRTTSRRLPSAPIPDRPIIATL